MKKGKCKLCQEVKDLAYSHIFPEFFYRPTYDETNTYISISDHPHHPVRPFQKGLREYLLCLSCEGQINRYETYVARFLENAKDKQSSMQQNMRLSGLEYHNFKLFGLSLIWRAHISRLHFFRQVDVGPHAERIRLMLVEERPGKPHEYGIALVKLRGSEVAQRYIESPRKRRFEGIWTYQFAALGFAWVIVVSSHAQTISTKIPFVGGTEDLLIPILDQTQERVLYNLRWKVIKMGKLK